MTTLKKDQVQTILDNAPKGADKKKILDGLIQRGYAVEGVDSNAVRQKLTGAKPLDTIGEETPTEPSLVSRIGTDLKKRGESIAETLTTPPANGDMKSPVEVLQGGFNVAGDIVGGGLDVITQGISEAIKRTPGAESVGKVVSGLSNKIADLVTENPNVLAGLNAINSGIDSYKEWALNNPEDAKTIEGVVNIASILPIGAGTKAGVTGAVKTAENVLVKTVAEATPVIGAVEKLATSVKNTIDDFGRKITEPELPQATKVSLNPKEALTNTLQDIDVSVGGKIKKLSQVTPEENIKIQEATAKSLDTFTEQATKFANDRSIKGGSPVEIVGQRVDRVLDFADKKRQLVGKKMGDIETKYVNDKLPVGEKTNSVFAETIKNFDNPKFGVDTADSNIVRKLVTDFDNLEKGGATIGERLNFVRSWDKYLNDAKDAFGNFKENATANTRIQNAVKTLKNETVDAIAKKDKVYRNLRTQYRVFKQLNEIGDSLLGKEGALGERIKGAATVKRAIQSNSDAGARQFLTKLKELTGYDAIKEGDLALTAMENVGDYQGLSLLNIIKEGKTGLINKGIEKIRDTVVGSQAERVKKYIKK